MTKRQIVGLVGAVLLLLGIAFFAYDFVWRSKIKPEFVKNGSFVQTIVASGHVESPHRISISAQITGTVSDVPVLEGQTVEKGQLLIALENTELHSALRQAQASEQQALSNLRQLRELKAPVAVQLQIQADANFANAKNNLQHGWAQHLHRPNHAQRSRNQRSHQRRYPRALHDLPAPVAALRARPPAQPSKPG